MRRTATAMSLRESLGILTMTALALPRGGVDDEVVVRAIRRVYELAHGRVVETKIGAVPIAPAVAPSLANALFHAATRPELLEVIEEVIASARERRDHVRPAYFAAGSALREFLDGRLGAPEFWANGHRSSHLSALLPATASR